MLVDPDFPDHWKTRMLVAALSDEAAPVYVLRIWAHCQNRRKARFENFPAEALKALCHFPGQSNKLESSLVASGFVVRDGKDLLVVGWEEHNAKLVSSWRNGEKGGRPKVPDKPNNNPTITQVEPIPSTLLSVLEGLKSFNTEKIRNSIAQWEAYFRNRIGRKYDAVKLQADLAEAARKKWDAEKLETAIQFSIAKDAKSWIDPDADFEKQAGKQPGKKRGADVSMEEILAGSYGRPM